MRRRGEEKKEKRFDSVLSFSPRPSSAISTLAPPHFPFGHTAPSHRKNKGNFQNRSYHLIIDERNEKTDLNLSFTKETIGFYFQRAILAVDSLWVTNP